MFEVQRAYPTALAAGPHALDLGLRMGAEWVLRKQREIGGTMLLYVPRKASIADHDLLADLCELSSVHVGTWRTDSMRGWREGPVLAVLPTRAKLAGIIDHFGVSALCVVPLSEQDTAGWAATADPVLLPGATPPSAPPEIDPVIAVALDELTVRVNQSNHLAGALDQRDAVVMLTALHRGGYRIDVAALYARALGKGWTGLGAERLREMAVKINSGVRMRTGTREPAWRPTSLPRWRNKANDGEPAGSIG